CRTWIAPPCRAGGEACAERTEPAATRTRRIGWRRCESSTRCLRGRGCLCRLWDRGAETGALASTIVAREERVGWAGRACWCRSFDYGRRRRLRVRRSRRTSEVKQRRAAVVLRAHGEVVGGAAQAGQKELRISRRVEG